MTNTVFFSWQSDTPTKHGRNFIEKALTAALSRVTEDGALEEAVREGLALDKDTKGVPGSPPIFDTILRKIDKAAVFVPDLTFGGKRNNGKPTPNPNVLIEYGWALKSLTHSRIVPVMNEAYGEAAPDSMPFDMAHLRFPITYNVSDQTPEPERKAELENLTRTFENAIRAILDSEEFKSSLPKPPEPPSFPQKQPAEGMARFRPSDVPLGIQNDPFQRRLGVEPTPIYLNKGAAIWLRVMPTIDPKRTWSFEEQRNLSQLLIVVPFLSSVAGSFGLLRGQDGLGWYPATESDRAYSVCYIFKTGEIWLIDVRQAQGREFVLQESVFAKTLEISATYLEKLGVSSPYRWIAGIEGFENRYMALGNFNRTIGPCLDNQIEESGTFNIGDDLRATVRPFFKRVFDACGAPYPEAQETGY